MTIQVGDIVMMRQDVLVEFRNRYGVVRELRGAEARVEVDGHNVDSWFYLDHLTAIPAREPPKWRPGRSSGQTIWFGEDVLHGMVQTRAIATRICDAMNAYGPMYGALEKILALATWDEEGRGDEPDEDDMCEALLEIHKLASVALRRAAPTGSENT